jgi:UDP-3-O-[3-hydroxymyristoyl] glucosamine N-acyltransferase
VFAGELDLVIVADRPYSGESQLNVIATPTPRAVFFSLLKAFFAQASPAFVAPNATVLSPRIAADVHIGYNSFIGPDVVIGARTRIENNVTIDGEVTIGEDCLIGSGAVIGAPGFGYFDDAQGRLQKIPDFGGVTIGDRVYVGANACISQGTLTDTIIGDDSKIDMLAYIAHNVVVGRECLVIGNSMLSGSVQLSDRVWVAPGATLSDHVEVGRNALIGVGAAVTQNVADNAVVAGVPARFLRNRG